MTDKNRQDLINKFLPQSKSHLVAKLSDLSTLPNKEQYNYIIAARCLGFINNGIIQTISIFFSTGLEDDDLCEYEFGLVLNNEGEICWLEQVQMIREGNVSEGYPTYFKPGETETEKMEEMTALADSFLAKLELAVSLDRLPTSHRLRQPLQFRPQLER